MMTPEEIKERRQYERFPILKKAAVILGAETVDTTIFDVSAGGAKLRLDSPTIPSAAVVGQEAVLQTQEAGNLPGQIVWTDDEYLGLSFFDDHSALVNLFND